MTLIDLFNLIPETQEMHLIVDDCGILGTMGAMECLLSVEAFNAKVVNIEAEDNKLKVWIKEST